MQVPIRRSQLLRKRDDQGPIYLTAAGIDRLKRELVTLEKEHPEAAEDVYRLAQLGDFSENAEYQEAKYRLRRMNDRMASIKERLKRVVEIEEGVKGGRVQIGSTVKLKVDGKEKIYQIVGPAEVNPSRGRISYLSPLGSALMDRVAGDEVTIQIEGGEAKYLVWEVA